MTQATTDVARERPSRPVLDMYPFGIYKLVDRMHLAGHPRPRRVMETRMASEHSLDNEGQGPKYTVDIEGIDYSWHKDTISVPEIRELGQLSGPEPIVEVNLKDNSERVLPEDAVIELKPGRGFARKVRFKRG
jgi:hypothetical protein